MSWVRATPFCNFSHYALKSETYLMVQRNNEDNFLTKWLTTVLAGAHKLPHQKRFTI